MILPNEKKWERIFNQRQRLLRRNNLFKLVFLTFQHIETGRKKKVPAKELLRALFLYKTDYQSFTMSISSMRFLAPANLSMIKSM